MKVKELIEELQKYDEKLTIYYNGEDGYVNPIIKDISDRDWVGINFLYIEGNSQLITRPT
jgi:hypothetical protein